MHACMHAENEQIRVAFAAAKKLKMEKRTQRGVSCQINFLRIEARTQISICMRVLPRCHRSTIVSSLSSLLFGQTSEP